MQIEHIRGDKKGCFRAVDGQIEAGRISYLDAAPNRMIVNHTEVSDAYAGRGIGKQLVMAVVAHARENGLKVVPLCVFVRSLFDKMDAIRDVLAK